MSFLVIQKAFKKQNTIFAKYLMQDILLFFLVIFLVITLIIFGNQLVLVIKESLKGGFPVSELFSIIGFKTIRDLPLILSLSLFLAIVLSISKFYKNSEAIVMNAVGIGDKNIIILILPLIIVFFIVILFLTTIVVPWSVQQRSIIMYQAKQSSEFAFIKAGEFQEFKQGNIVFYAEQDKDSLNNSMQNVFIYTNINNKEIITVAKKSEKYINTETNNEYLRLKNGARYHGLYSNENEKILNFSNYDLKITNGNNAQNNLLILKTASKDTLELMSSKNIKEIAEFQWRMSIPISILLLSMIAVLLGKTSPREGKNLGALFGVLIFIAYNNLILIVKSSVEKGNIPTEIGLWWVHLLILLFVWIFYLHRVGKINTFIFLRKFNVK